MFYYSKGLALLELVITISFIIVLVGGIVGTLHKLNLFHELDSRIESGLVDFQIDSQILVEQESISSFTRNLTNYLAKTISSQHTIGLNLIEYQGRIQSNKEVIVGQLSDLAVASASSIEELIARQIANTPIVYQEIGYLQNKYLEPDDQNAKETKFIIVRLLVKPDRGLIKILENFGFASKLYFEKIIKISK